MFVAFNENMARDSTLQTKKKKDPPNENQFWCHLYNNNNPNKWIDFRERERESMIQHLRAQMFICILAFMKFNCLNETFILYLLKPTQTPSTHSTPSQIKPTQMFICNGVTIVCLFILFERTIVFHHLHHTHFSLRNSFNIWVDMISRHRFLPMKISKSISQIGIVHLIQYSSENNSNVYVRNLQPNAISKLCSRMESTLTIFSFHNLLLSHCRSDASACPSVCTVHILLWAMSTLNESTFHIILFLWITIHYILATKARINNSNNNNGNNNDDFVAREFWNSTFYCNQFQIIFWGFCEVVFHSSYMSVCVGGWVWVWSAHVSGRPFLCLLIHHWNAIQFIFLILLFTILPTL